MLKPTEQLPKSCRDHVYIFIINGLLFWFVGSFIQGFVVAGFWWGVLGAIVYAAYGYRHSRLHPTGRS